MRRPDLPQNLLGNQPSSNPKKSNARIKSTDLITAWILSRMTGNKLFTLKCNQKIPNWTGFTSLKVSAPTIIGNCCTIPASQKAIDSCYQRSSIADNNKASYKKEIIWDIYVKRTSDILEKGVADATDSADFHGKLLSGTTLGETLP